MLVLGSEADALTAWFCLGYRDYLNLGAVFHFVLLWNCVCDDNSLKGSIVYSGNSWPREDPMSKDSINFGGSS
jgi:hypothetical protein